MPSSNPAARSLEARDALEDGMSGEQDMAIEDIEKEMNKFHRDNNHDHNGMLSNGETNKNEQTSKAEEVSMRAKKPKYGRAKDDNPDVITMDDFNQQVIKEKNLPQDKFDKEKDWDAKIEIYYQRKESRDAHRRAELRERAWKRRKAAMRYVFTGQVV
mmetsp:Transcript_22404/g.36009  ORF Transcript_22404/g.36009 Transcript_22404/m.36009 type:complete len:158 (+) Transcript_22404:112-585(+)